MTELTGAVLFKPRKKQRPTSQGGEDGATPHLSLRELPRVNNLPICRKGQFSRAEPGVGLGQSTLQTHGLSGRVVVICNFVQPPHEETAPGQSVKLPVADVPKPIADAYLSQVAASAAMKDESVICLRRAPGMGEHIARLGLHFPGTNVYEVDPRVEIRKCRIGRARHSTPAGFPHLDVLTLAEEQIGIIPGRPYLAATFPSPYVRRQAERLGMELAQPSDALFTNDKLLFRLAASEHKIPIFPGWEVSTPREAHALADELNRRYLRGYSQAARRYGSRYVASHLPYVARVKNPRSSGGDGVTGISAPATYNEIQRALFRIRASVKLTHAMNDYGAQDFEKIWPKRLDDRFPTPLVIEQDAATIGKPLFNGSFMVRIEKDGQYAVPRIFRQRTGTNGDYRAGFSVDFKDPKVREIFTDQVLTDLHDGIDRFVYFYCNHLNAFGLAGCDFFVLRRYDNNRLMVAFYDNNFRWTINIMAAMIGEKVALTHGFESWANFNGWARAPFRSMKDFEHLLDLGPGRNYFRGSSRGLVVPMAARSLFVGSKCAEPSNAAKFLVAAKDPETVREIIRELGRERKLRLSEEE